MHRMFSVEDESIGRIYDQLVALSKIRKQYAQGGQVAPALRREQLADLIETAFWSSLKSNEGRPTRVFISVAAPQTFPEGSAFAVPLPYDEQQVAKLAPAVTSGGCLAVQWVTDRFMIWGISRSRPAEAVSVELSGPGTVRLCVGPFQPFAVLDGRSNPVFQGSHSNLAAYLHQIFKTRFHQQDIRALQTVWRECLALTELARMIVDAGCGGAVLIVPDEHGAWPDSLSSFSYRLQQPDTTIHDATHRGQHLSGRSMKLPAAFRPGGVHDLLKGFMTAAIDRRQGDATREIRSIATLSAIDGAIVMTRDLRVLGFGAKIAAESAVPAQVCMFRPEPGTQPVLPLPLEHIGGTRHQSAARFAAANKDCLVLVISQDRHMSVVHWHEPIQSVAVVRNAEWWV